MPRQFNTRADNNEDNFVDMVMQLNRGMQGQFGQPVAAAAAPGDPSAMIFAFSEYKEQSLALAYKMQRILDQKQLDCQTLDADVARLEKELEAKATECSGFASQITTIKEEHSKVIAGMTTDHGTEKGTLEKAASEKDTELEKLKADLKEATEAKEAADKKLADTEAALKTAQDEKEAAEKRAIALGGAQAGLVPPPEAELSAAKTQEANATILVAQARQQVEAAKTGDTTAQQTAALALTAAEKALADAKSAVTAAQGKVSAPGVRKNSTEQGDAVSPLKELTAAEAAAMRQGLPKGDVEQYIALTEMGRLAKKGRDEGGRAQRQFLAFSRDPHLKSNPLLSDILEADCEGCKADPTHHKRLLMAAASRQDELIASVGAIIAVANSAVA